MACLPHEIKITFDEDNLALVRGLSEDVGVLAHVLDVMSRDRNSDGLHTLVQDIAKRRFAQEDIEPC